MFGNKGLLLNLVRGAQWGDLADYISPALFDIIPANQLRKQGVELARGLLRPGQWRKDRRPNAEKLQRAFPNLKITQLEPKHAQGLADEDKRLERATLLLELYFYQILRLPEAWLDLRTNRFSASEEEPVWDPVGLRVQWDPEFLSALRDLYCGFYRDNSMAFEDGLRRLNLYPAREIFIEHFGSGDQTNVQFSLRHFHETFHKTFLVCKKSKLQLHPNFVALGLMLACLYQQLEDLNVTCDVRAAFDAIERSP